MEKGDISDAHPPRLVFTWDTVAHLPDSQRAEEHAAIRFHRWKRACSRWVLYETMHDWLWQIAWNTDFKVAFAVLDRPPGFADAVRTRVDSHRLPVRDVLQFESADHLARRLAHMPDVQRVYFSNPRHGLKYGRVGEFVPGGGAGWHPFK